MRLTSLQVSDYRNISRLDLNFMTDRTVLIGDNAQGKSNILESVYLLATLKAPRAESDAQLIRREALADVLPVARVVGVASTVAGPAKVELTITTRPGAAGPIATKTVKLNGVPKRASDVVGRLTAVLFTAEDLEMIAGSPSLRRRYLDLMLSQLDPRYAGARSRFDRVLTQRNSLLKRLREGLAQPGELEFWDGELSAHGSILMHRRGRALAQICELARQAHSELAPGENLTLEYQPKLESEPAVEHASEDEIAACFRRALASSFSREIAAGMTLTGPHRDDLMIALDDMPAAGFASRAQQRTIALSMRLAEAQYLRVARGEPPVLLLDDILSEMDAHRRQSVLAALDGAEQMMVTGTDRDRFPESFLAGANLLAVEAGSVRELVADVPGGRTGV